MSKDRASHLQALYLVFAHLALDALRLLLGRVWDDVVGRRARGFGLNLRSSSRC